MYPSITDQLDFVYLVPTRDSTSRLTSNSRASRVPAEMFMGTRVIMGYIRLYVDSLFYAYKIVKNDSPDYPNC